MAALSMCGEPEGQVAFFGNADQRDSRRNSWHETVSDGATLVHHEEWMDAALLQQLRGAHRAWSTHFLGEAERENDRAAGLVALLQQRLHRLEGSEDAELVIECAASPDVPVGDVTRKGAVLPVLLGAGFDGHDILVAQQQYWSERRVGTLPRVEQCGGVHDFAAQLRVHSRERAHQERAE